MPAELKAPASARKIENLSSQCGSTHWWGEFGRAFNMMLHAPFLNRSAKTLEDEIKREGAVTDWRKAEEQ